MLSFAALSINRFFTTAPKPERETPGSRTATLRALSDLGESVASSVHAIYAQSRLYLCVAMQTKPEALHAQRLADKKAAASLPASCSRDEGIFPAFPALSSERLPASSFGASAAAFGSF